jgi:hypothetical protein
VTEVEDDERRRLRQLKMVVDLTANVLAQGRMTRAEGEALVAAARKRVLELFPDKAETYELILAPRFARLLEEFAEPPPPGNVVPFPHPGMRRPRRFPVE